MDRQTKQTHDLLTTEQTAEWLQLEAQTLAKWRVTGKGPRFVKLGRAVRYRIADVDEWIERGGSDE